MTHETGRALTASGRDLGLRRSHRRAATTVRVGLLAAVILTAAAWPWRYVGERVAGDDAEDPRSGGGAAGAGGGRVRRMGQRRPEIVAARGGSDRRANGAAVRSI